LPDGATHAIAQSLLHGWNFALLMEIRRIWLQLPELITHRTPIQAEKRADRSQIETGEHSIPPAIQNWWRSLKKVLTKLKYLL
jgi:hypothetical protein